MDPVLGEKKALIDIDIEIFDPFQVFILQKR